MNYYSLKISKPALPPNSLKIGILLLIALLLCSHVFSNNATPQNREITFDSDSIEALYNMLPENLKNDVAHLNAAASQSILSTGFQDDSLQLIVRINAYDELSHIGIHIFPIENDHQYYNQVFEFIEREMLRYHILKEDAKILERMKNTKVALYLNDAPFQKSHYSSILSICPLVEGAPFILDSNKEDYKITWKLNSVESLSMQFPNNYLVISGKRKDEIEKEIARDLKNIPQRSVSNYMEIQQNLNNNNGPIDTLKGEHYEGSAEISTDTYYYADSRKLVFDTAHVKESISNLLLNVIPTKMDLDITHNLYGNATDQYSINLNDFMNYFSTEHKIYCVVNDSIKNNIQASIFVYNIPFNYVHLLTITTSLNEVINHMSMNGMLYTFIRKDNVKKRN